MKKLKEELLKLAFVVALMALMLTLFIALGALVESQGWDIVQIVYVTVLACGLYILLVAIKIGPVAKGRPRFNLPGIVVGTALICGSVLYSQSQDAGWFVFCLIVPIVIGGIIACIKGSAKAKGKTG